MFQNSLEANVISTLTFIEDMVIKIQDDYKADNEFSKAISNPEDPFQIVKQPIT